MTATRSRSSPRSPVVDRLPAAVAARYLRQILLTEVGPEGQRRILASVARVAPVEGHASAADDALAHEIASLYAARAGAKVAPGAIPVTDDRFARDPAAGQVLRGARAALTELRAALFAPDRPAKLGGEHR